LFNVDVGSATASLRPPTAYHVAKNVQNCGFKVFSFDMSIKNVLGMVASTIRGLSPLSCSFSRGMGAHSQFCHLWYPRTFDTWSTEWLEIKRMPCASARPPRPQYSQQSAYAIFSEVTRLFQLLQHLEPLASGLSGANKGLEIETP
jgi:hypothetical protein